MFPLIEPLSQSQRERPFAKEHTDTHTQEELKIVIYYATPALLPVPSLAAKGLFTHVDGHLGNAP